MAAFIGCQWNLKSTDRQEPSDTLKIERYDRIETLFLTTGDYGALKKMNTDFPAQTMTLVETVLGLGAMDEPGINDCFYEFYQDSTLQKLLLDVSMEFDKMDDIDVELASAFDRLHQHFPHLQLPHVYTQVSALSQSIIVGNGLLAISLDKYMGENYPLYLRFGYTEQQRRMMTRQYIVPDCVGFFLLSAFPVNGDAGEHRARLQWVVNAIVGRKVFDDEQIAQVEHYMQQHKDLSFEQLLTTPIHII